MTGFSHLDNYGKAVMVDVSGKEREKRTALAAGKIKLGPKTLKAIKEKLLKKGDVLSCARIAGIGAAKKTSELIPLCHNIPLDHVDIDLTLQKDGIKISASAITCGKTGVEMEALTAVSVAALTIYDMCKAIDKEMVIESVTLVKKSKKRIGN